MAEKLLSFAETLGHGDAIAAREPGHGHETPHRRRAPVDDGHDEL